MPSTSPGIILNGSKVSQKLQIKLSNKMSRYIKVQIIWFMSNVLYIRGPNQIVQISKVQVSKFQIVRVQIVYGSDIKGSNNKGIIAMA